MSKNQVELTIVICNLALLTTFVVTIGHVLKPPIDAFAIPVLRLEGLGVVLAGIRRVMLYGIEIIAEDIASVEVEIQVDGRGIGGCSKNNISVNYH